MSNKDMAKNSGRVNIYIDDEGEVSGDLFWNCDEDLPEEQVDVLVDALHGLMAMLTTRFDDLVELGQAFQAGAATQYEVVEQTSPDTEKELELPSNVISLSSSNRKH